MRPLFTSHSQHATLKAFNQPKAYLMPTNPADIQTSPVARAIRALEMLDFVFPGYTIQAAVTEALQDMMHLEDAQPDHLHLIGALDDARNQHEDLAEPAGAALPADGLAMGETAQAASDTADFSNWVGRKVQALAGETAQLNLQRPGHNVIDLESRRFQKAHEDEPQPA